MYEFQCLELEIYSLHFSLLLILTDFNFASVLAAATHLISTIPDYLAEIGAKFKNFFASKVGSPPVEIPTKTLDNRRVIREILVENNVKPNREIMQGDTGMFRNHFKTGKMDAQEFWDGVLGKPKEELPEPKSYRKYIYFCVAVALVSAAYYYDVGSLITDFFRDITPSDGPSDRPRGGGSASGPSGNIQNSWRTDPTNMNTQHITQKLPVVSDMPKNINPSSSSGITSTSSSIQSVTASKFANTDIKLHVLPRET